jgi:hypothetical protein
MLAVRAGGNTATINRYERDLAALGEGVVLEGERHEKLWNHIAEFTPGFLSLNGNGAVVRVSCTLKEVEPVMASFEGPALARAGSGVCYGYFESCEAMTEWLGGAAQRGWRAVVEFAPEERKKTLNLWPDPAPGMDLMRKVKALFDPSNLLNRGRLYSRI